MVQSYGVNSDDTWARFLDGLEGLPEDIKVIGINDYWFLDGYKKVLDARRAGRLRNLDAVFPVVEIRLDQFGGTQGHLSRVNLHVIFDPELDPAVIEAQFLNALQPSFQLSPEYQSLEWRGVITQESLADLGHKIKQSVPATEIGRYGSDLQEGFNNLNVSLSDVQSVLKGAYFRGKALLGIGKTEWADVKWSDQSIASKKNVINEASLVFTAYQDPSRWKRDVQLLRESNVTHQVLDCSDAHAFKDATDDMRLGQCLTWMNTTPSFAGLSYALQEFDRRVFVGLEPPSLARIRRNPERFIDKISVKSSEPNHNLFDYEIPLNAGFVAIVGNKGQGKSALLDCIALAGNSSRKNEFAFLTPTRFLSATSIKQAKAYFAEVEWANGAIRNVILSEDHDRSAPVSVEYLPQAFVERVCNVDPAAGEADEFEHELRTVLFTHIPEEERAGEKTFDALLGQKARASQDRIDRLRDDLRIPLNNYIHAAAFRADNQLVEVDGRLKLKEAELAKAEEALAVEQAALAEVDSAGSEDARLTELKRKSEEIETQRLHCMAQQRENQRLQAQTRQALTEMDAVIRRVEALTESADELNALAAELLPETDAPLVVVRVNRDDYEAWRTVENQRLKDWQRELDDVTQRIGEWDHERQKNTDELASADAERERARQRVIQSEERVATLTGNPDEEHSLEGLKALRQRILDAPANLEKARQQLVEHAGLIHAAIGEQLDAVQGLYGPASEFIANSEVVSNAGLEFKAELRMLASWRSLAANLDGRRNGDFPDWLSNLPQRVENTSWSELAPQLSESLIRLEHERGDAEEPHRNPTDALRSTTTLEEFLLEMLGLGWLDVRFGLTGDGLPLSQLSPGQRGLVLTLFYLVVDRRTTPLLLDQPEENLDNETIASKLVPAIHEAAGRRQTIVVTHNANLAVVGDADQIIHCQFRDKQFAVTSGSIAELNVAQFALDILEGTKPAFDNRRHKYEKFPELT